MKALFTVLAFVILLIGTSIVRGFVLAKLWLWFVVSQLQAPGLSVAGAIGIASIVGLLTFKKDEKKDKPSKLDVATGAIMLVTTPLTFLLTGWVVKQFL